MKTNSPSTTQKPFENGKLLYESSEKLIEWTDNLNRFRRDFTIAGFNVPQLDLALIEAMRSRSSQEKRYECYLDEVLKESVQLPRGLWNVETRKSLQPEERSKYLDFLQNAIQSNEFGPLGNSQTHAILDPNYILYSNLKVRDITTWEKHISVVERQKQSEIHKFHERINLISPSARTVDSSNVIKVIQAIADEQKLECALVEKGRTPRVILRTEIADGISMYLEWSDLLALRKWGSLQLVFVVQESDRQIWASGEIRSCPFAVGLSRLVPGGDWYSWKNADWDSMVLGFLANAEFLRICSNQLGNA